MAINPHKHEMPTQDPVVRAGNYSEVALGYTQEIAVAEAARCLECKNMPCVSGCPVNINIPGFIAQIKKGAFLSAALEREMSLRQIAELSIKTSSPDTVVQTLSGGNQQKCIIGRWLETKPRILILDEPTRGIDVGAKYEIYMLMKKAVENGSSIILISSELPEVLNMSNRVLTIAGGRITGEFDPEKASAQEIMNMAIG